MINFEKLVVIDIETLKSAFVVCCLDYKTGNKKSFTFFKHDLYDAEPLKLFKFLKNCQKQGYTVVSFNGIGFDMPILHYFFDSCEKKKNPLYEKGCEYIIDVLYKLSQDLIHSTEEEKFKLLVPEKKLFLPTIDLYKQQNYGNKNKRTSLKWVEFSMRFHTIQEMPIAHDEEITKDQLGEIVEYCWNDVIATKEFFDKVKYETEVRLNLSTEFDLNLINDSEPSMVRKIFGKFLCEEMKLSYNELKELKTFRKNINFKDIIFPYIKFQTPKFQKVLDVFVNTSIDASPSSEDKFSYSFPLQELSVDLGLGGIHACIKPGVCTSNDQFVIRDFDFKSFYPFLAIKNDLRPEHLGDAFNKVYSMMYDKRLQYDKKDPRNYIFKIILNSACGLSKESHSYLYDPRYFYTITIGGQLSILMFVESLYMSIPDIQFIQMNTDGITVKYDKQYTEQVNVIYKWIEKTTNIELEDVGYQKMIIADCNNYIAIKQGWNGTQDPKDYIKKKGLFETEMPFHKNPSSLIVPKALEAHFVHNLTPKDFICSKNNSIFDYCLGVKKKSNFKLNLIQNFNFAELIKEQQKVCRFFVSDHNNESGVLVKDFKDGRRVSVIANKQITPLYVISHDSHSVELYPVDYEWYIKKCRDVIASIEPSVKQLSFF